jgi:hypothetical protein
LTTTTCRGRPGELVQERVKELLAWASRGEQLGQPAAGLPGDIVQPPQRPGRQQRVAGPQQEPGIRRPLLGEPPDQRRLADAGLARHQDDPATHGRVGQRAAQLVQQRGALEQVHDKATLPERPPRGSGLGAVDDLLELPDERSGTASSR